MDFRAIWEFMNTQAALYVYAFLIFLLIMIHRGLKKRKIKLLMEDGRFADARLFRQGIATPIAITKDGHIGVVPSAFSIPIITQMKTVIGYEIFFDGHSISKSEKAGKKDLVFGGTTVFMEERLKVRVRKILLSFIMKNDYTLNVYLFNASTRPTSAMNDATRNEIKEFFTMLEEVEKNVRGSSRES